MRTKELKLGSLFLAWIVMLMLMLAAPVLADDETDYDIHFHSYVDENDATLRVSATPDGHDAKPIKDGYRLPEGYIICADTTFNNSSKNLVLILLDGDGIVQQMEVAEPGNVAFLDTSLKSDINIILRYEDQSVITLKDKTTARLDVTMHYVDKSGKSTEIQSGEPVENGGLIIARIHNYSYDNLTLCAYAESELALWEEISAYGDGGLLYPFDPMTGLKEDVAIVLTNSQGKFQPAGTKISSLTAGHKKMTVKWAKPVEKITGYEIRYSKTKNFKSGTKTKRIKTASTTKCKLTGLKKGKRYYVKIRTYLILNGNEYFYSNWSKAKSVKVK